MEMCRCMLCYLFVVLFWYGLIFVIFCSLSFVLFSMRRVITAILEGLNHIPIEFLYTNLMTRLEARFTTQQNSYSTSHLLGTVTTQ